MLLSFKLNTKTIGGVLVLLGFLQLSGIFALVPVPTQCTYTASCSLANLNPGLGLIYLVYGGTLLTVPTKGFSQKWIVFVATLVPILILFLEFDLTQGGPFGTFRVGGVVMEHEGIGFGILSAISFFKRKRDPIYWVLLATGAAMVLSEVVINQLVDVINNPFGIFFSTMVGFLFAFGLQKTYGAVEVKDLLALAVDMRPKLDVDVQLAFGPSFVRVAREQIIQLLLGAFLYSAVYLFVLPAIVITPARLIIVYLAAAVVAFGTARFLAAKGIMGLVYSALAIMLAALWLALVNV